MSIVPSVLVFSMVFTLQTFRKNEEIYVLDPKPSWKCHTDYGRLTENPYWQKELPIGILNLKIICDWYSSKEKVILVGSICLFCEFSCAFWIFLVVLFLGKKQCAFFKNGLNWRATVFSSHSPPSHSFSPKQNDHQKIPKRTRKFTQRQPPWISHSQIFVNVISKEVQFVYFCDSSCAFQYNLFLTRI